MNENRTSMDCTICMGLNRYTIALLLSLSKNVLINLVMESNFLFIYLLRRGDYGLVYFINKSPDA